MDKCLFLCHDCILLVYVDDCLIFSPLASVIDTLISNSGKTSILQDEGDVSAFLGVQVKKDTNQRAIILTQPSLIAQIIKDVGLNQFSTGWHTPTDSILHADPDGPPHAESWNYRSGIGKLNCIENNTCPDISMTVHQCAHFCAAPKALHELAVKRIVHYLHRTKDKGLILKPSTSLTLDMFVDANFCQPTAQRICPPKGKFVIHDRIHHPFWQLSNHMVQ